METVQMINIMDIIVLLILVFSIFSEYRKGLLRSVYHLFSSLIGFAVASKLYPTVSAFIQKNDKIYSGLRNYISESLGIHQIMGEQSLKMQTEFINNLPIPDFMIEMLLNNNNAELHRLLEVSAVEDYITKYLTNICINIISMAVVFVLTIMILRMTSYALKLFENIPVMKHFNRFGGAIIGFIMSTLFIWVSMTIFSFFFLKPSTQFIWDALNQSHIAIVFFENNWIMDVITRIIY